MNEPASIKLVFDATDLEKMFESVTKYVAQTTAAVERQNKINEVLFGLIMASPIGITERDAAREVYERALKE